MCAPVFPLLCDALSMRSHIALPCPTPQVAARKRLETREKQRDCGELSYRLSIRAEVCFVSLHAIHRILTYLVLSLASRIDLRAPPTLPDSILVTGLVLHLPGIVCLIESCFTSSVCPGGLLS